VSKYHLGTTWGRTVLAGGVAGVAATLPAAEDFNRVIATARRSVAGDPMHGAARLSGRPG
jgi:hypothetical protein